MKKALSVFSVMLLITMSIFAQGFKVKASGEQTFNFADERGRNQASFFSGAPLEDITGLSNEVKGSVTFNVNDIKTLSGKIFVPVASIKTGIDMRDEHMRSANWLNAAAFPEISFVIKKVNDVKILADNKLSVKVTGTFTLHGVSKEVATDATLTYLDESEQTKMRAPGDLLGIQANFKIKLSDYGVDNKLIGQKVSEIINVSVNIVGSNAK